MKKTFKRIIVVFLAIFQLFICITFVFYILDTHKTYLEGFSYASMEELHYALVERMNQESDESIDFWIRDLVIYFEIEDVIAFASTYSKMKTGDPRDDELFVQFAKKQDDKYYLLTPKEGYGMWATCGLNDNYSKHMQGSYYSSIIINGTKQSLCFLYKNYNETRKVYFDGIESKEVEVMNPFSKESFYICYAMSYSDSFWDRLTKKKEKLHTVELK